MIVHCYNFLVRVYVCHYGVLFLNNSVIMNFCKDGFSNPEGNISVDDACKWITHIQDK